MNVLRATRITPSARPRQSDQIFCVGLVEADGSYKTTPLFPELGPKQHRSIEAADRWAIRHLHEVRKRIRNLKRSKQWRSRGSVMPCVYDGEGYIGWRPRGWRSDQRMLAGQRRRRAQPLRRKSIRRK